jgi:hypothetical protein
VVREAWLWGSGGYYTVLVDDAGTVGLPAGREAYLRVARYAPEDTVAQMITLLEAYRDHQKTQEVSP